MKLLCIHCIHYYWFCYHDVFFLETIKLICTYLCGSLRKELWALFWSSEYEMVFCPQIDLVLSLPQCLKARLTSRICYLTASDNMGRLSSHWATHYQINFVKINFFYKEIFLTIPAWKFKAKTVTWMQDYISENKDCVKMQLLVQENCGRVKDTSCQTISTVIRAATLARWGVVGI